MERRYRRWAAAAVLTVLLSVFSGLKMAARVTRRAAADRESSTVFQAWENPSRAGEAEEGDPSRKTDSTAEGAETERGGGDHSETVGEGAEPAECAESTAPAEGAEFAGGAVPDAEGMFSGNTSSAESDETKVPGRLAETNDNADAAGLRDHVQTEGHGSSHGQAGSGAGIGASGASQVRPTAAPSQTPHAGGASGQSAPAAADPSSTASPSADVQPPASSGAGPAQTRPQETASGQSEPPAAPTGQTETPAAPPASTAASSAQTAPAQTTPPQTEPPQNAHRHTWVSKKDTVFHPAETREETVTVVDRPARTETVIVGWESRFVCGCGSVFRERSAWERHADGFADRAARGEISAQEAAVHSHYTNGDVPVVETVQYPEETHTEIRTVTVREAWEETVVRWKCSGCGTKPDWAVWGWED